MSMREEATWGSGLTEEEREREAEREALRIDLDNSIVFVVEVELD